MSNCQTECDDAQYGDDHIFIKYAMEMLADGQSTYLMCSSFRESKKNFTHTRSMHGYNFKFRYIFLKRNIKYNYYKCTKEKCLNYYLFIKEVKKKIHNKLFFVECAQHSTRIQQ